MTNPNPPVEKWEEEFEKISYHEPAVECSSGCPAAYDEGECDCQMKVIKSFISSQIKEAKKEMLEKVIETAKQRILAKNPAIEIISELDQLIKELK